MRLSCRSAILAATFLFSLMVGQAFAQDKEIRIVGGKSLDSPSTQYLIQLYTEAFDRIGYKFIYERMPNNRASVESDKGEMYAGELSRVSNYDTVHPKLIKLDIPHYSVRFIAISAKYPRLELDGWESLRGKDLKVAYRRGTKIFEDHLPELLPRESIIAIADVEQGLKLALWERVDVFLEGSVNVAKFFEEAQYNESGIYFPGVMEKIDIHMFIHENYGDLIPLLNTALSEMHEEGLFEKFRSDNNFEELEMR